MAETPAVTRVAVVLFEGFTVLDVYGPVQAFGACRVVEPDGTPRRFFEVFTIGDRPGPVRSGEGPSTHVDHAFAEAPPYDIVLVPGGFGTRAAVKDEAFLARLGAASQRASSLVSPRAMPSRISSPRPMRPTTSPPQRTSARLTRCTTARIQAYTR